jgi:outer membrane lipopolysaccharide assembly protein LptE/RlpB
MRKTIFIPFYIVLITGLTACGFYSFTGASIPAQAQTFSVNYFPNLAPMIQPTLSQVFTDALKDQFTRQTNLKLINGVGDLHFEGSISGYSVRPQAIGADDRAAQNRLTISVRVKFINEFQPENDFEQTFSRYYDYNSSISLAEVENEAIAAITEALVEDIFNSAVVNW